MDEPKTDSDQVDSNAENPDVNADQKPVAKPARPASPKAFDIFSPGQTTPPASARPIIVSHRSMAQDTTVTGKPETLPAPPSADSADPTTDTPKEEHQQLLDTHKKLNLKPFSDGGADESKEADKPAGQTMESVVPKHTMPAPEVAPSQSSAVETKDQTDESKIADPVAGSRESHDSALEHGTVAEHTPEPPSQQAASSPAFSPAEHTDPPVSPLQHDDELLIPAHTGEGYNEPVQSSDEQFNQFVVHHHKTARQRVLKRVGIVVLIVVVVAAAAGAVLFMHMRK